MTSSPRRAHVAIGGSFVAVAVTLASLFPGLPIDVGSVSLRLDQILTLVLAPWWLVRVSSAQARMRGYEAAFVLLVTIWLAANFVSSALAPAEPLRSLRLAAWPAVSFSTYLVVRAAIGSRRTIDRVVQTIQLAGAAMSAYAVLAFAAFAIGAELPGVRIRDGEFFGVYATMHEPNIFGSFLVIVAAFSLAGYLFCARPAHLVLFALCSAAIVLTFTRVAIGSLVIATCLLIALKIWKTGRLITPRRAVIVILAGLAVLTLVGVAASDLTLLRTKLTSLDIEGNTLLIRLNKNATALREWTDRPLLGYGTDAFGRTHIAPGTVATPDWLGTQVVQSIYDTGVFGAIAYVGFTLAALAQAVATFLASRDPEDTALAAGLLVALAVLLGLNYQFTTALWFAFNWVLFAVLFALRPRTARLGTRRSRRERQSLPL